MNQRIHQAIEHTHAGLKSNEFLADKIISEQRRLSERAVKGHYSLSFPQKLKRTLVFTMALLLITITAIALIPRQSAITNYGLWLYEDGKLIYQDREKDKSQVVLEDGTISHIASDPRNNTVYYITSTNEGQRLEGITEGGFRPIPGRELSSDYIVHQFKVEGSMAYMLADTPQGKGQLWRIDLFGYIEDQLLSSEGWQNEHISSFCVVDERTLYAHSNENGQLFVISTYDYTAKQDPLPIWNIYSLMEGYEQDGVRYLFALTAGDRPRLVIVNTQNGEKQDAGVSIPRNSATLMRDRNHLYVVDSDSKQLASYRITELSGQRIIHTLTIVNGLIAETEAGKAAERLFHEKYPNVEIVHRWIDDPRVIVTEMMANEGNFDIITLQPGLVMTSVPAMLRSGAIMDVTDFEAIQDVKKDWRNIWDMVSVDGHQYGVPVMTSPYLWQVNPEVAQLLGWDIPEGKWNWTEFDELIDRMITYNQQHDQHLYLLADSGVVPFIIDQYQQEFVNPYTGTADYQTERFRNILSIWMRLYENDLLYPYAGGLVSGRRDDPHGVPNTLLRNVNLPLSALGNNIFILPPVWDENTPQLANVSPMCISGNSRYPEAAAYFLACYASVEATSKQYYGNYGQWLNDGSLYVIEPFMESASEANTALWNTALEMCEAVHEHKDLMRMHWRELLPMLLAGEITPDKYMDIAQQQADMYIGE